MEISPHEREICLRVLQQISEDPSVINHDERMKALIAKIHTQGKKGQRRAAGEARAALDRELRASAQLVHIHQQRALVVEGETVLPALPAGSASDSPRQLSRPALCYVCKQPYTEVHWFYHLMCNVCAEFNWKKREQRANLQGRIALLTGGRIKIGYEVALRLLRDGATVLLTTRFPHNAVRRFSAEPDFEQWSSRLQLFGLDLRDVPSVEAFANQLNQTLSHLDIIIHNAAQTVKRPLAFYRHLLEAEQAHALPENGQTLSIQTFNPNFVGGTALLEQHPLYPTQKALEAYFPQGRLDADGQQFDARPDNSWRLKLDEVSTLEMLEVQLVNAVAPFVLNARLKPLLVHSPHERRFIVNVSAMEGQFGRKSKTCFHPHTNMAKAALNMMTRTSASDFALDGIYMNSVDTGWITDENPHARAEQKREHQGFYTPLDAIDGAARIYDPIAQGINEADEPLFGHFLKDYAPHPW